MTLINATPHSITLVSRRGVEQDNRRQFLAEAKTVEILREIPPSGILARVSMVNLPAGEIDGIAIESVIYGEIEGLPEPQEGVFYIVSGLVANAATKIGRVDCLAPGALVRDKSNPGTILGCLFLQVS
jgi:hypothetical protein